jgi:hypothetical protein
VSFEQTPRRLWWARRGLPGGRMSVPPASLREHSHVMRSTTVIEGPLALRTRLLAAQEIAWIKAASVPVAWRRPSDSDPDRATVIEAVSGEDDLPEVTWPSPTYPLRPFPAGQTSAHARHFRPLRAALGDIRRSPKSDRRSPTNTHRQRSALDPKCGWWRDEGCRRSNVRRQ